jgi:hypothetical protein
MKRLFLKTFLVILLTNLIQNSFLDLNILNNPLLNKSPYLINKELNESIYQFLENFTNFSYLTKDLNYCLENLTKNDLGYMYLYSGKGIAEPGLELECKLLDNFTNINNNKININKHENETPILQIDVNLKHGMKKKVFVYEGDTSENLAKEFSEENGLDNKMRKKLQMLIQQEIDKLLTKIDEESQSTFKSINKNF